MGSFSPPPGPRLGPGPGLSHPLGATDAMVLDHGTDAHRQWTPSFPLGVRFSLALPRTTSRDHAPRPCLANDERL